MKNDWALVVGINHYPSAGVDPLEGAVHDANEFYKWLVDSKGGAVEQDRIACLTSPDNPDVPGLPRPVLSEIFQFFEVVQHEVGGTGGRRLYVYLSGHGISPTGQESVRNAALLMANAKAPKLWPNFAGNIWAEGARSAALFREVVLFMDCCRDLKNNASIVSHSFGDPVVDSKDCRMVEAYATGWASKARELPIPPGNEKQGVFTHSLLAVLKSGKMTGTLLKESVKKHLELLLKDEKKAQEPEIGRDEDLAQILFNEQADPPSTSVTLKGHPATLPSIGQWPEGSDELTPVLLADWSHEDSVWRGTLAPGLYELRLPTGKVRRLKVFAGTPAELEVMP